MRASFNLNYRDSGGVLVDTTTEIDVNSTSDKKNFVKTVALILGVEIELTDTFEEKVFKGSRDDWDFNEEDEN